MNFSEIFKKSFLNELSTADISLRFVVLSLGLCCLFAAYIFFVYQATTRKTFFDRNTCISIALTSVIVCGIILTIQSSLVVSLGMVGALSIVRFRTAIKNPMDLMFMFWAIAIGIICGVGLPMIAIVLSFAITGGIIIFNLLPIARSPMLLIVNASADAAKEHIFATVKEHTSFYTVKSQVVEKNRLSLVLEVRLKKNDDLISEVSALEHVTRASLLSHDGEVTF